MLAFRNKLFVGSFGLYTVASRFNARPSTFAMSSSPQHGNDGESVHVEQYLNYSYKPTGKILKLRDETEFYAVGNPRTKRGVIIVPDLGGYNAGNSRNIADYLAANGTYVAIPGIMGTPKGAEVPSMLEASSLAEYSKMQALSGNLKPKVRSIIKHMQNEGVEKVALIGFSWGGWVATNVLASDDLADKFTCGVLVHPSINLEERMYGGSLAELFSHVKRPILVLPARGDPHEYDSFVQMLKYRCPSSDVIDYRGYEHNFLLRGRVDDRDIRHADTKALHEILSYLNYHFDYEASELNRHVDKVTGSGGNGDSASRDRTWSEYLQESYNYMREGVAQTVGGTWERAKDNTQQLGESLQGLAYQLREDANRARDAFERTVYRTEEEYDKAKREAHQQAQRFDESATRAIVRLREDADKVVKGIQRSAYRTDEEYQQAKQHANEQAERMRQDALQAEREAEDRWNRTKQEAKETWNQFKERSQRARDTAGEYVQGTWDNTKEGVQQTRNKAGEYAQQTGEYAQGTWNKTKEGAQETWDKTKEGAHEAGEYAQQTGEKAKEGMNKARQRAGETGEHVKERTPEAGQHTGEATKSAGEKIKEGFQTVGESYKRIFSPDDKHDHDPSDSKRRGR